MSATPCTGLSAFWCHNCGDCTCERLPDGDCCFDGAACPLHGPGTKHAETIELAHAEGAVRELAEKLDVDLTENDRAELSRFAQWLFERSRLEKLETPS